MGPILWVPLCEATNYLWWCEPPQAHDRLLVFNSSKFYQTAHEGNADWPCYHSELVICEKWSAQVNEFETTLPSYFVHMLCCMGLMQYITLSLDLKPAIRLLWPSRMKLRILRKLELLSSRLMRLLWGKVCLLGSLIRLSI